MVTLRGYNKTSQSKLNSKSVPLYPYKCISTKYRQYRAHAIAQTNTNSCKLITENKIFYMFTSDPMAFGHLAV